MAERIISLRELAERRGESPQTTRRGIRSGLIPLEPVQVSPGKIGFLESEADALLRSLPRGWLRSRTAAANASNARGRG
jgi:hypothetical protein